MLQWEKLWNLWIMNEKSEFFYRQKGKYAECLSLCLSLSLYIQTDIFVYLYTGNWGVQEKLLNYYFASFWYFKVFAILLV